MINLEYQQLHRSGKLVSILVSTCTSLVLLAFTWQAFALGRSLLTDDPEIQSIEVEATLPLYDPAGAGETVRTVYFDNGSEGIITTTMALSGTPNLTVTDMPAFGQPITTAILTSALGTVVITYPVSTIQGSQAAITYTVVNTYEVATTAVISYMRDITPPLSTLDNLPPGGLVITTPHSSLVVTGTVSDDESGVKEVWFDPGTGTFASTTLDDRGDWVQNSRWSFTWSVPDSESGVYTLRYYAEDNIGHEETAHTYMVTVNNKPLANDNAYSTTKNAPLVVNAPGVLDNDEDPRSRSLTAILITPPANGELAFNTDGAFVYTPTAGFVGNVTFSYKANNGAQDSNTAIVTIHIIETDSYIYLPLISKPPFAVSGDIDFVKTDRFAGISTFKPQVQLDFGNIGFTYLPEEIKIWIGNNEPAGGWIPYVQTPVLNLVEPTIGGHEIHVKFRYQGKTVVRSAFFFYIPNGDFHDGQPGVAAHWSPQDNGLPWSVENSRLRLGSSAYGCSNMPFPASATASIMLNIPDTGYILRVEAVVYTYDKLPDPTQSLYDAFEIHVGGQTGRYGYTGPELLSCNTQRTVLVDSTLPLPAGEHSVRLENHSRFDNYYNTYTDVVKVWVDK
jgi:hypothetical protein